VLGAVAAVAGVVRLPLLRGQPLWPDEVFSLAMATGHSLEHPAADAQAALGDFVEADAPGPPTAYRRYLEHEEPAAGATRVVRATRLSDTSPPLYYLLLNVWTRALGTSDVALRAFSLACAFVCLPLLWRVAGAVGGRRAALAACALFALAPLAVYYSTEGRMYALLWLWTLSTAWLVLRLARPGGDRGALVPGLAAVSAAGLLTHYFFVFVWAAMLGWLLLRPRARRGALLALVLTVGLVLPWYAGIGGDLARWRVTKDWLHMRPEGYEPARAPLRMALGFLGAPNVWGAGPRGDRMALVIASLMTATLAWKLGGRAVRGRRLLVWGWLAAACIGPSLIDVLRGTFSAAVPRYALAGLPAALSLLGLALGRLPPRLGWAGLVLILLSWWPSLSSIVGAASRNGAPLDAVARELGERAGPGDVVLVHSIPSGVLGVARYLAQPLPMASWVGQLGTRRVPDAAATLSAGRRATFLVLFHSVGEPAPEEGYLREHAQLVHDDWREAVRIVEFRHSARR
jgi:hypothetical protein